MSADYTLIFFGVRYALTEAEVEAYDKRTDERVKLCRRFNLDHWNGTFPKEDDTEGDFFLIGKRLALIGYEGSYEVQISPEELTSLIRDTTAKLRQAGIEAEPKLWIQFGPDH